MVSSNGNIFRVTGNWEFTGHRWIPRTEASDVELWCFLWSVPESPFSASCFEKLDCIWWCHQMEIFSALLAIGNSSVTGEFPAQRPVTWSFDVFFDLFLKARFLPLAPSKLKLCSANHRAGYFSNLAGDWLSIVWAYSEQETENRPWWFETPSRPLWRHCNEFQIICRYRVLANHVSINALTCNLYLGQLNIILIHLQNTWTLLSQMKYLCMRNVTYVINQCVIYHSNEIEKYFLLRVQGSTFVL